MMIYKIHFGLGDRIEGGSDGFYYAGSKAEAIRGIRYRADKLKGTWPRYTYECSESEDALGKVSYGRAVIEITSEPTPRTKAEWINYLNKHGEHPNNG
jgi:hypothetical protein